MIYWREKQEEGELEDYFPGDVVELAESKEDLARKLFRRRIRFPEHVFDDVPKAAPSRGEPSQKEKKKRKEAAKRKEMVAFSELPAAEGEERNNKVARLEQEIVSLRRKLADEKKRNRELQEVVVKGMEKLLEKSCCCSHRAASLIQEEMDSNLEAMCLRGPLDDQFHLEEVRQMVTHSLQDQTPPAVKQVLPLAAVAAAAPAAAAAALPTPLPAVPAAAVMPPPQASTLVAQPTAMPLVAGPPAAVMPPPQAPTLVAQPEAMLLVAEPPVSAAHQCVLETEATERNLGHGITIPEERWKHLMAQPKDSLFVREAAKAIWGVHNLYNRSIAGTPCHRFLHKEGGPPSVEKRALTPRKLDVLRNAYEEHLRAHASLVPDAQRRRNFNRHLADLLKVLKF
ncbi:uncharacterized protein LOC119177934 [Rhipicephalus microplus]|uniref:uncharacterized protein LOC119177934 n=1 Tax=Rhipicephalus microplus TaxID=6941 RepID=UPI003F6B0166